MRGGCFRVKKADVPFASDADVEELVTAFENATLPYSRWTHRAHLAVAVVYLTRYGFDLALDRIRLHIRFYNLKRGDPDGYHETITALHMLKVAAYLNAQLEPPTLLAALDAVSALLPVEWVAKHYSPERLRTDAARTAWVDPDREPLDF